MSDQLFDAPAVREMTRAIHALALELRTPVWRDVNARWNDVLALLGHPALITYEQQAQSIEAVQAADQTWESEPNNIVITKSFRQAEVVPGPTPYYQRNADGKWEATNCLDLDR
jgi:hypothetical protein